MCEINGVVLSVHGDNFQCYFTGPKSFNGILRKLQPFDATEPIFPNKYHIKFASAGKLEMSVHVYMQSVYNGFCFFYKKNKIYQPSLGQSQYILPPSTKESISRVVLSQTF